MAIADAFNACWKGKYTYWTARPSMRDPSIDPVIPNPNFPSYPSGHSSLGGAAAAVLSYFYPRQANVITQQAIEDRDSRIWAGVHFPVDDQNGYDMGYQIGQRLVRWQQETCGNGCPKNPQGLKKYPNL